MARKKAVEISKDKHIQPVGLVDYSREAIRRYGEEVIEHRALPDYRDGLKPVQRRVLWSMHKLGNKPNTPHTKSARTVGDVLGKYHPHGDTSCYQAMVNMANSPTPMIDGKGNWGGLMDGAASMRYTNARLSKYSQEVFFNENFVPIIELVNNYDDKDKEPLILPALLPNVIINGTSGIGVGTTACLPSYTHESVAKVVSKVLSGEKATTKLCAQTLVFKEVYGGKPALDKTALKDFYDTGKGAINFTADYELVPERRLIIIKGVPDGLNVLAKLDKVKQLKSVQDIEDKTSIESGYRWHITLGKSVPQKDVESEAQSVLKHFEQKANYVVNVTERYVEKDGTQRATFRSTNIPQLINDWCDWRVGLELKSLKNQIDKADVQIRQTELKILGASKIDIVVQALKMKGKQRSEIIQWLANKLKINLEDATFITNMQVIQLSSLDESDQRKKLKELQTHKATLQKHCKKPQDKVLADLSTLLKTI